MPNLPLEISTNQRPPLIVTWPQWRLLIGQNFLIADLAYLSNSKTISPLVKFWSGRYFNIFFSKNLLLRPIPPIFFLAFQENGYKCYTWKEFLESLVTEKLWCPNFDFWNANISLVEAQIFACSKPLFWIIQMVLWDVSKGPWGIPGEKIFKLPTDQIIALFMG